MAVLGACGVDAWVVEAFGAGYTEKYGGSSTTVNRPILVAGHLTQVLVKGSSIIHPIERSRSARDPVLSQKR